MVRDSLSEQRLLKRDVRTQTIGFSYTYTCIYSFQIPVLQYTFKKYIFKRKLHIPCER